MQHFSGTEYLYIDIANQYGWDKESWDYRIQWTIQNMSVLEGIAHNADEPHLYLKAVQALRDTQKGIPTGFIMGLDACSSGVQILSAVMGCTTGSRNCGLIDTNKREDFYTNVTAKINSILGTNSHQDRKIVKGAAMTVLYGSKQEPIKAFGEDTDELAAFYQAMENLAPGAMRAMRVMLYIQDPTALEYKWTMPDGHKVIAKVIVPEDKRIEVDEFEHATFTHRTYVNAVDKHDVSLAAK